MEKVKAYVSVLRFDHWIKNLFFLPGFIFALAFTGRALTWSLVVEVVLALLVFGLVASVNYTINEIIDAPFDRFHPVKKLRAVPSGRVKVSILYAIMVLFLFMAAVITYFLLPRPLLIVLGIFLVSGIIYNIPPLRFKDVAVLDVITESVNNPIRFTGGWLLVSTQFPPWLLLITFWALGAFWMAGKRYGEMIYFKAEADKLRTYRKSFQFYTQSLLLGMIIVSAGLFVAGYIWSVAVFLPRLGLLLPFVVGYFAWYFRMIMRHDMMVREPETLIKNIPFLLFNLALGGLFLAVLFL